MTTETERMTALEAENAALKKRVHELELEVHGLELEIDLNASDAGDEHNERNLSLVLNCLDELDVIQVLRTATPAALQFVVDRLATALRRLNPDTAYRNSI